MIAFILVIVMFFVTYNIFSDAPNALSIVWLCMLVVLGIAKLVTKFVIRPKLLKKVADDNNLDLVEVKSNPEIAKQVTKLANKSIFGDLGSYFGIFLAIFVFRAWIYEPFKIPSGSMQPTLDVGDFIAVNKHHYRISDPIFQKTLINLNPIERGDVVVFKSPQTQTEDWIKRVIGLPGDLVFYNSYDARLYIFSGCKDVNALVTTVSNYASDMTRLDTTQPEFTGCTYHKVTYGNFGQDYKYTLGSNELRDLLINRLETLPTSDPNKSVTHQTLQYPRLFDYESFFYKQDNLPAGWWNVPEGKYFMMGDNRDNSEDSRFVGFVPYENIVGKAEYIWFSLAPEEPTGKSGVNFKRIFKTIDGSYN